MKVVFMGTPDFAVPCLQKLIDMNYDVKLVVTQPDKPKGRGKHLASPPVKELALEHNIKVSQPEKVKKNEEFINELKEIEPDVMVVVAYGKILPKEILEIPKLGCINVHGSILPKYRGSAPIQWSVIDGEKITGVTTMYMDEGMDTGDMILKASVEILEEDTSNEVYDKLCLEGAELLEKTLKLIKTGNAPREKQNEAEATYAKMLDKNTGNIKWDNTAKSIKNLIRGTNPWPGAFTFYDDKMFKLSKILILSEDSVEEPGTIVKVDKEGIVVSSKDKNILIENIQPQGKKMMRVEDYLRGNTIEKGKVFSQNA